MDDFFGTTKDEDQQDAAGAGGGSADDKPDQAAGSDTGAGETDTGGDVSGDSGVDPTIEAALAEADKNYRAYIEGLGGKITDSGDIIWAGDTSDDIDEDTTDDADDEDDPVATARKIAQKTEKRVQKATAPVRIEQLIEQQAGKDEDFAEVKGEAKAILGRMDPSLLSGETAQMALLMALGMKHKLLKTNAVKNAVAKKVNQEKLDAGAAAALEGGGEAPRKLSPKITPTDLTQDLADAWGLDATELETARKAAREAAVI